MSLPRPEDLLAHRGVARPLLAAAAVALAGAYCYVAAGTTPFTEGADLVTAVPFLPVGAVMARSWVRRRRRGEARLAAEVAPGGDVRPWVLVIGALVVWELATYAAGFEGGRHAWPTVSSLADEAFRWRGAKAALFGAWLAAGWALVRR
jgi:hypothetical protein